MFKKDEEISALFQSASYHGKRHPSRISIPSMSIARALGFNESLSVAAPTDLGQLKRPIAISIRKHKDRSALGIHLHLFFCHLPETIETLAHVARIQANPHFDVRREA